MAQFDTVVANIHYTEVANTDLRQKWPSFTPQLPVYSSCQYRFEAELVQFGIAVADIQ